jgi:NagD protein
LIGANPDTIGITERGVMPATGSLIAPIEIATGKKAYFVGKPNPVMLRHAMRMLDCHSADVAFIGDRMDTDIIAGIESNVDTILVLSGEGTVADAEASDTPPTYIMKDISEVLDTIRSKK